MHDDDASRKQYLHSAARHDGAAEGDLTVVACPFCGAYETELVSLFGGQLSTDQYYCRVCRSYFERFTRDAEGARG